MTKIDLIIKCTLVALCIVLFIGIVEAADKLTDTLDRTEELEQEMQEKMQDVDELKNELEREVDSDYIIDIARENGYRSPDEIIINNDLPK